MTSVNFFLIYVKSSLYAKIVWVSLFWNSSKDMISQINSFVKLSSNQV